MKFDNLNDDFADLIQKYKSGVKVIRRIPSGARFSVAIKLKSLINDWVALNSVRAWQSLSLFAFRVLSVNRANPKHTSLTKAIKENTAKETFDIIPESRVKVSIKNIIESKVADGDIRGAIRVLSSADSIAPENDETLEILRKKHPAASGSAEAPNEPQGIVPLTITEDQVYSH